MSLEIEATDVIKIILQFCKENALTESFNAIQSECQVSLNTIDSLENFVSDINSGRWDVVLPQVAQLKLPRSKLEDLYEQVVLEMIELREAETARAMLRHTQVFQRMKVEDPERYLRLEHLCGRTYFDPREVYGGGTKEKKRAAIAHALSQEVSMVPPSRLMALVGQALKQQGQGLLPPGVAFDLFRGQAQGQRDEVEAYPTAIHHEIKFAAKSHPEAARFSPDGTMLVTGSMDGFIEVWDSATGKLKKDLVYQAEEMFMMHDEAVLALNFSRDSELLVSHQNMEDSNAGQRLRKFDRAHTLDTHASSIPILMPTICIHTTDPGSQDGRIKVWKIRTGQCLRKFDRAHTLGTHASAIPIPMPTICIHTTDPGSQDGRIKVWKIRTGQCLRKFDRAHTQGITCVTLSKDGSHVLSGSFDGSVRVHGLKSGKMLKEMRGHTSFVNDAIYSADGSQVISASSDATVRVWDAKTCECLQAFRPPQNASGNEVAINSVHIFPQNMDQVVVCNRSSTVYMMTMQGMVVKSFASGKREGGDFLAACVSPRGDYIYCLGEDSTLYCFAVVTGKLEHVMPVHDKGAISLALHPHRNLLATWAESGPLKCWAP
eukprot:gene21429-28394_t